MQNIRRIAKNWFNSYSPIGQFWLAVALVAVAVDAGISFKYGWSQTSLHAAGFALVAVFFSLLPDAAYTEIENKRWVSGFFIALACIPLGVAGFYSHLGYGASVRVGDMQQTGVQNAKYDGAQEAAKEDKANLEMWKAQLDKLMEQDAWAATVKAEALRDELVVVKGRMAEEEKGRRGRKAGKGKEFEKLENQSVELGLKIAKVEQRDTLTTRIDATKRKLDDTRKVAASTEYKSSAVVNQNNVAAQIFLAMTGSDPEKAIKPDSVTQGFINILIAFGGSLAFMVMAPIGFFVAGRHRIKRHEPSTSYEPAHDVTQATTFTAPTMARDLTPVITNTKVIDRHHRDPRVTDMLHLLAAAGRRGATA